MESTKGTGKTTKRDRKYQIDEKTAMVLYDLKFKTGISISEILQLSVILTRMVCDNLQDDNNNYGDIFEQLKENAWKIKEPVFTTDYKRPKPIELDKLFDILLGRNDETS